MTVRTVRVIIEANVAGAIANIRAFRGALNQFGNDVDQLAVRHAAAFNRMTTQGLRFGLALTGGFLLAERTAMQFDKQMSAVFSVSQFTAGKAAIEMGQLRQAALNAGRDSAFTATQAAKAEEELAKAGVSTADILGGGLRGALNLAAAGSIDLAKAASIAAIAMNQFGLSGRDISHVADVLTSGANKSATDVAGLGFALGQTGAVAHQLNISLDETVGVLSSFAMNGMLGEEAGTALKTMLVKLEAPSAKAAKLMQEYGISLYDANGQTVTLAQLAGELRTGLGGLSEEQRNAALATMFGTRAIKAATTLYQEGQQGIQDWTDKVNDQGVAARTAAMRLDNLAGDLKKLGGTIQFAIIEGSGGATLGLRALAKGADFAVKAFADLPRPVNESITILVGLSGVTLLAASGFLKLRGAIAANVVALNEAGWTRTATALGNIGKWAGRATLVGAAVFGVYEGFKALSDWAGSKTAATARNIDLLGDSLTRFAQTGKASGELAAAFGANMERLSATIATAKMKSDMRRGEMLQMESIVSAGGIVPPTGMSDMVDLRAQEKAINQAKSDLTSLDQALANIASSQGGATVAAVAFGRIKDQLLAEGMPLEQVNKLFEKYEAAAHGAAAANTPLAHGFAEIGDRAKIMAGGLQDLIEHGQSLADVWKSLNGAAHDLAGAEIDLEQGLSDLTDQMAKNGNSIEITNQAGRDNMKIILKLAEGAQKAAQAKFDETSSVEAAKNEYDKYIGKLRQVLHQAGLTDAQIQTLIDTYAQMPKFVDTRVTLLGFDDAMWKITQIKTQLNSVGNKTITLTTLHNDITNQTTIVRSVPRTAFNRWGGVYPAAGGLLSAGLFSAGARPLYQFAEPETGGEAFIPRMGDIRRSRGIADYVVSRWLGGTTDYGAGHGGSGAGNLMTTVEVIVRDTDNNTLASLRRAVNARGGNVQAVVSGR